MKGIGQLVEEGEYPVTLVKVTSKKTQAGNDMLTFQATIRNSDTDFDGRSLFRNFVISNDPDKDNSGVLYYLQMALVAFGGDPDDMDSDKFDVEDYAKGLYGNRAIATVTHRLDANDPDKKYLSVEFSPDDL
jgi:hypothetical protein